MVPKIIHQIVGPAPSPLIVKCLNSWQITKQYGFEISVWDDSSLLVFITEQYPFVLDAFKNARNYAEASDIARYLIIYHYGGYYIDWDIQLLSIAEFLSIVETYSEGFLVQDPVNQSLASEAFSGEIGDPFLLHIAENIKTIYSNGFRDSLNTPQYSGPYRMREVYYFMKGETKQRPIRIKDIFLYDYWEIKQKPPRNKEVAMIHYWAHGWMQ